MSDPFKIVGDRVARASEKNFPHFGTYTWKESKSNMRIREQELTFGEVLPGDITPITLKRSEFINNTSVQNSQVFAVEETTTESYTTSVEKALELGTEFEADIPFVGGTKNSIRISTKKTNSQTQTEAHKWSYQSTIFVPPRRKIVTSFIVNEATFNAPFKVKAVVRGKVYVRAKSSRSIVTDEISNLINRYGWHPTTFQVKTKGRLDAVIGQDFVVTVDEYELDDTPVFKGRVLARGHLDETGQTVLREFQSQPEPA
ncbi:ETX/MTX2 family pore-forming toxin [Gymnodinialimonas sp. 2305UL16-5]|uniref:ETX/MTX2 family pore-forming toxin n=1 Tax=Gymnodinialimonas mytili TaxID=3126503 RepID=UPI00309B2D54